MLTIFNGEGVAVRIIKYIFAKMLKSALFPYRYVAFVKTKPQNTIIMKLLFTLKSCFVALLLATSSFPCLSQKPVTEPPKGGKQISQLGKKAQSIINDINAQKEVKEKKYLELEKAYNEVLTKAPQDEALAKYHMSLVSFAKRDFDQYTKLLQEAEAKLPSDQPYYTTDINARLGWCRYMGQGIEKNDSIALEHFEKAYEADSVRTAYTMAWVNILGIGDYPVDYISAIDILQQSCHPLRFTLLYAIQDYLNGLDSNSVTEEAWTNYTTGILLFTISGLTNEAIPCLEKSVNLGFMPARKELADIYLGKRNIDKAIEIIKPASDRGYPPAVHQHGYYIYVTTLGRAFQYEPMAQVADLWIKAADLGFPNSLWTVGELYINGYGTAIKKDLPTAYRYLSEAVASGMTEAEPLLNSVKSQMAQEAIDAVAKELQKLSTDIAVMDIARKQKKYIRSYQDYSNTNVTNKKTDKGNTQSGTTRKKVKYSGQNISLLHTYNNWVNKVIKMKANPSKYYNEKDLKHAQQEMKEIRQMIIERGGSCPESEYETWHP